jgi:chromosome segregation ATPase
MLLREIGQREDLKNKLEKERRQAEDELLNLEER